MEPLRASSLSRFLTESTHRDMNEKQLSMQLGSTEGERCQTSWGIVVWIVRESQISTERRASLKSCG